MIEFNTQIEQYQHWSLEIDGVIATLKLGVNEDAAIQTGYKLKLNSYDLGVDIELHDAVQRAFRGRVDPNGHAAKATIERRSAPAATELDTFSRAPASAGISSFTSRPPARLKIWS